MATNLLYPVSNCHAHDLFNIYLFIILPSSRWSNLQAGTTRAEYLPMYKRAIAVIRYRINYIFAYVTCSSAHEGVLDCFSGASAYVCCMKHLSTHCTSALCMQQLLDVAHDKFSLHILHFCKTCRCIVDAFVRQAFHQRCLSAYANRVLVKQAKQAIISYSCHLFGVEGLHSWCSCLLQQWLYMFRKEPR